jgi:hypothetical protein
MQVYLAKYVPDVQCRDATKEEPVHTGSPKKTKRSLGDRLLH